MGAKGKTAKEYIVAVKDRRGKVAMFAFPTKKDAKGFMRDVVSGGMDAAITTTAVATTKKEEV